ncbi:MAG: translation elongation factor Ts [Candidatus Omnitrophota bacterium]
MMTIPIETIKQLREMTLASISDCKQALEEANGDLKLANEILKKKGLEVAAKRAGRAANQGRVEAYIHLGNKIGVLVEVNSETDFVAKNDEFIRFSKDVAMQIAATEPKYVTKEDVPKDDISQLDEREKADYFKANCLLSQPFVKDAKMTIQDYLNNLIARIGENIVVRRFCRFKLGEDEK